MSSLARYRFDRCWAIGLLILIGSTWRLWIPLASPDYPLVPLVSLPDLMSFWIAMASIVLLVLALLRLALGGPSRLAWCLVAIALVASFVADQHRLQPWAYQSAVYACLGAGLGWPSAHRWMIPIAASVYIFSAAGKLDFQFAHTVGQEFLGAILSPIGGFPDDVPIETRAKLALLMPASELMIGVGLFVPITRRVAGMAAMLIHVVLITILGPWALGHSLGVLGWNVLLIVQAWLLFVQPVSGEAKSQSEETAPKQKRSPLVWFASGLVAIVCFMPLLERRGYWDHWLSWSLYSPHTSRLEVELSKSAARKLPDSVRRACVEDHDVDGWTGLSLANWSLDARGVPVYPQARYQRDLVKKLCEQSEIDSGVRGVVKGVSNRWSGQREQRWFKGLEDL